MAKRKTKKSAVPKPVGLTIDDYRKGIESGKYPQPMHSGDGRPPGWFTGDQGRAYMAEVAEIHNGFVVEVGCYMGRSMSWIAPSCIANGNTLFAVDPWENCPRCEFEAFMRDGGWLDHITIVQARSVDAAKKFDDDTVSLCFIDAWHDYESVKADIGAWWPKVKAGGVLMGHDYEDKHYGVREAVDEKFGDGVRVISGMWHVRK
jgi:predicted O-methyltransferase YrrM